MKKYKVLVEFTNKVTQEVYSVDSTIELTEDRANEILAHPSIVAIREIKNRKPRAKKVTPAKDKVGE